MSRSSASKARKPPARRERFFKERRIDIQLIDLKVKPMAAGEIRRFIQRFTLNGLLDTEGKAFVDAGLKYIQQSESQLLARIEKEPKLLRLPLVRCGQTVCIGQDESGWKAIAAM
ncbi:MAG: ArsC/Spx/MgsR family protein [Paludibaculum sp.]